MAPFGKVGHKVGHLPKLGHNLGHQPKIGQNGDTTANKDQK